MPKTEYNSRIEDNEYFQPKKITVKFSCPEMGLGVFATDDIEEGELVERVPMIPLSWRSKYLSDPQILTYCYTNGGCDCDECKEHGSLTFMALGYGMIYNHQENPNCNWNFNFLNLYGDVIAVRKIQAGEEIFVSYGSNYFTNRENHVVE